MHWWQAMHANNSWQRIVDIDSVICNSALWGGLLAIEEDIKCTTAIQLCHALLYPPHCCVPENCMGLGQIVQGFLQILLSSKTNEDNKDKWFHLTHWQPHLCALFFASFEILSQGKFSHFCLLWEGLWCGRMCWCNRTTMPWFPPNLKFSFTLSGASSKI